MRVYMCARADLNFGIEHITQASFSFGSSSEARDFSRNFREKHVIFPDSVKEFYLQELSFIYRTNIEPLLLRFTRLWFIVEISRATCGSHRGLWWFRKTVSIHLLYGNAIFVIAYGFGLFPKLFQLLETTNFIYIPFTSSSIYTTISSWMKL